MILGAVGQCAIAFATAGAKSYPVYATLRFLITFFGIGMFLSGFVIGKSEVAEKIALSLLATIVT